MLEPYSLPVALLHNVALLLALCSYTFALTQSCIYIYYNIPLVPVELIFYGISYPNNSVLSLNDIGNTSTGSAILCTTNRSPCCSSSDASMRFGEWYYPNGAMVLNNAAGEDFYRGRRDNQTIRLSRRNNAQFPTGSFCCELPDSSDVNHTLCVSLSKQAVTNDNKFLAYTIFCN